jgi:1-acyl-sn-glycerol-3-phosphate acyltransferase
MIRSAYYRLIYLLSWPLFAAGAAGFALCCVVVRIGPRTPAFARTVRGCIRRLFRIWTGWLDGTGLIRIEWRESDRDHLPHPAVYVANHPGMLDAPILLSRLRETVCIVKPALMRHPLLGPAARAAQYAAGDGGVDTLRFLLDRLAAGQSVLIFPEGTRTHPRAALNPLKPGFALIARRAGVPIQMLLIDGSRDFMPGGRAWWRIPRLPGRYRIRAGACVWPQADASAGEIAAEIQSRFAAGLGLCAPDRLTKALKASATGPGAEPFKAFVPGSVAEPFKAFVPRSVAEPFKAFVPRSIDEAFKAFVPGSVAEPFKGFVPTPEQKPASAAQELR